MRNHLVNPNPLGHLGRVKVKLFSCSPSRTLEDFSIVELRCPQDLHAYQKVRNSENFPFFRKHQPKVKPLWLVIWPLFCGWGQIENTF